MSFGAIHRQLSGESIQLQRFSWRDPEHARPPCLCGAVSLCISFKTFVNGPFTGSHLSRRSFNYFEEEANK